MQVKIKTPYFDKNLDRAIEKDEVIEISKERKEELLSKGIQSEIVEDEIQKDEVIEKPKKGK